MPSRRWLDMTSHRPWPMPKRPWVMAMTWSDLLFVHWRVDADLIRGFIPAPLELDLFDGAAWLAVVPFMMSGVRGRWAPPIPGTSRFPELNVRTYVRVGDRPGVYFFSLDAANRLAVATARATFNLPYMNSRMSCSRRNGDIAYTSVRTHRAEPEATLECRYRPTGPPTCAEPGTLDHWLTERYCLYTVDRHARARRADIHHVPWPLQPATWEANVCDMTRLIGFTPVREPDSILFAERLDVVAWLPERAS